MQQTHGKRKWEENDDQGNKGKRGRLGNNTNGAGARQRVNVDAAFTRKTLAEVEEAIGESNLIRQIRAQPGIAGTTLPITPDTHLDIWNSIRLQTSNNPQDPLQRVRTADHRWNKSSEIGPDPVFYLRAPGIDPSTASINGEFSIPLPCQLLFTYLVLRLPCRARLRAPSTIANPALPRSPTNGVHPEVH